MPSRTVRPPDDPRGVATDDHRDASEPAGPTVPWHGALAGVAAAAAALGATELVAGMFDRPQSLIISIGDWVIDTVPGSVERAAIEELGTADKPVLVAGILLLSVLFGAALGMIGRRRFPLAAAGFVAFAVAGVAAALNDPRAPFGGTVLVGLVGAVVGVLVLHLLLAQAPAARRNAVAPPPGDHVVDDTGGGRQVHTAPPAAPVDRRRFLTLAGAATVVGAMSGIGGWVLAGRDRVVEELRAAIRLPKPAGPAGPVPPDADLEIPGLTPLFVANDDFFRIDTALRVPDVDTANWRLEVRGMVDRPFSLTYDELMAMPHIEADITLACVSNEVGGELVGNARWQGVPLHTLLERAGVQAAGKQLMGHSVDGFTAGFPTVTALDVKEAMVAVAMNGEPLPALHGFPARIVVPGLYGYVSATKWLSAIELTDWEEDGYWIPRGWAKEGPIKTQARIDVPKPGGTLKAGRTVIAGVAWAPTRGIEGVEVQVDDGPWQAAKLAAPLDVDCWRQWHLQWDATPGEHLITARATDGAGEVQTDERTPVAPDGASGYPYIRVEVEG